MWPAHLLSWGGLGVLLYVYFGYPALLFLLGLLGRTVRFDRAAFQPTVSVVLAAWNEAEVIGHKIENTLGQQYPPDRLDLVVVSDGSADATDEIVEQYAEQTARVKLLRTEGRQGKSAALNIGVSAARGDIVVMTDANAMFELDAVASLVGALADSRVGSVSGELRYRTQGTADTESAYWRYERGVKALESRLGLLLGANGSIYALRRELFRPVKPRDVNDFRIPYEVLLQGKAVILEPKAISYEAPAGDLHAEYRRKVRIMSRAIPTMLSLVVPTLACGKLLVLWQLLSHKVLREIQGFWFLAALVGSAWGAILGSPVLLALFAGQAVLYLLGALGWALPPIGRWRPARLAGHFDMIVLASLAALGLWLTGRVRATWEPARPPSGRA